ncbi:hypothetical protein FMM80_25615 [Schaedlerella arabinosiphila]|uniref:Uncharacterized protein n=1 Tax=Schaedlerella arabinosiphila TaxID=2044587 RepID=A0A9X5H940_9FIRM|nr:hypothetical protein [Schaedlerella arabinosiphila]KAI4441196.1 hypothetical protein C824_003695 [Schaedlerella arabinosiphila]NDO71845.1 hypothetical protein [Schaedlerella arabinosiphila]
MKTKWMCMILMFALALNLSACGNRQENGNSSENGAINIEPQSVEDGSSENTGNESSEMNVIDLQDNGTDKNIMVVSTVKDSAFSGKVSGCYYAGGSRIIVAADKLYLYDMGKGETIASADISMGDLCIQTFTGGYFVVGQGKAGGGNASFAASESDGINGYILNKDFAVQDTISFSGLLSDDFIVQITGIAVSQDGKQVAFGGLQGLYLYDTSSKKVRTILDYDEDGRANNIGIVSMDSLTFTGNNTLVYVGTATDISNGGDGFSVYGTVSTDSANITITKKADYQVDTEEIQKGGNLLAMPQSFNKNNGTLLMLDTASMTEKMITFSSRSEGKDGVYCSGQGKYVATAILEESSVTINIYDTASGKSIHTEIVQDSNSAYFMRVPQILILDESGTCIVVLGRGIDEVSTLITTFGFVG